MDLKGATLYQRSWQALFTASEKVSTPAFAAKRMMHAIRTCQTSVLRYFMGQREPNMCKLSFHQAPWARSSGTAAATQC